MANPSPICTVKDGGGAPQATTNGVDVTPANTVTVLLADIAGVNTWTPSIIGSDQSVVVPTLTIDSVAKTATFTAPARPWSLIFKSTVNNGIDVNGRAQASYSTTFKICATTTGGQRLVASNELNEGSANFGWITCINAAITAGVVTLAGNVTGPSNANVVEGLTGAAGIVTFPIGNILRSTGASDVDDIITTSAGLIEFGNQAGATNVNVKGLNTVTVWANAAAGYVHLLQSGSAGYVRLQASSSGIIYLDANQQHLRDGAGNAYFTFDFNSPSLKCDSGSGTFPAFGIIRFKEATGTLLSHNYSSSDYGLLSVAGNGMILGARHNNANPVAALTLNIQATGHVYVTAASTTYWDLDPNNYTFSCYKIDADPKFSMRTQGGDVATRTIYITGQQASPTATGTNEDGGHVAIQGGTPDGSGVYGLAMLLAGFDRGYGDYPWPADSNQTLTAAQSTLNIIRLSAGTITAGRDLTVTRRAAAPGQILIRNVCGQTITVKWLTGTGVAVANNTSALIGSDGTNAILLQ